MVSLSLKDDGFPAGSFSFAVAMVFLDETLLLDDASIDGSGMLACGPN